jgi:acetyl-CoA acetyltransferase
VISGFSGKIAKKYEGSAFELMADVAMDALNMAGLGLRDVDGLSTTFLPGVFDGKTHLHFQASQVAQYLGIRPKYLDLLDFGGASALAMIPRAINAVASGLAENVLCILGGKGSEVRSKGVTVDGYDRVDKGVQLTPFDRYYRGGFDFNPVTDYALAAQRHAKVFGTRDEQRAMIAVSQRKNSVTNPYALYPEELTVERVLSSPVIAEPLHLLEAVYPVDGFHAFVVSKRNRTLNDLRVEAYGEAHWPEMPCELDDLVVTPALESSRRAGFDPRRADCLQLYDSFTITVLLQIEDVGLAKKGQGGKFVESTDTTRRGELPINTGGGSLNTGQPAYMSGGVLLEEAVRQLNGLAGDHQLSAVKSVFLNGIGGWGRNHSVTLVLGV